MKSRRVLALAAVTLFVNALAASAQPPQSGVWTAVGSTGSVAPQNVNLAMVPTGLSNSTRLGFQTSAIGTIYARFNVTNLWAVLTDMPPWTTLELGAINTNPIDFVQATLYQVDRCTGNQIQICTVTHDIGGISSCKTCTFPSNSFNFSNYLYYIEVRIDRSVTAVNPQLTTLRILQ